VARDARGRVSSKAKDRGARMNPVMAAAKELWPNLDVSKVRLVITPRPSISIPVAPKAMPDGGTRIKTMMIDDCAYTYTVPTPDDCALQIKTFRPLMTTSGYALSWSPELNLIVWYDKGG